MTKPSNVVQLVSVMDAGRGSRVAPTLAARKDLTLLLDSGLTLLFQYVRAHAYAFPVWAAPFDIANNVSHERGTGTRSRSFCPRCTRRRA